MAGKKVRTIFNRFFVIINCIFAGVFLIACLVPYLNPSVWWFMGLLGIFGSLPCIAAVIFHLLLVGCQSRLVCYFNHNSSDWLETIDGIICNQQIRNIHRKKDSTYLRIVDWNIRSLVGLSDKAEKKRMVRSTIPETIINQNPDIICLQEFNNSDVQII